MRQLLKIVLLSITVGSCKSDPPVTNSDATPPYAPSDSARTHFLYDAMDFTIEYLYQVKSPDTSRVIPADSDLNRYLLPLARLYDARDVMPLLDTLIVQKAIHKYVSFCSGFSLKADTSFAWVQNVMKGITPTGNVIVDSLVKLYDVRFLYVGFPSLHLRYIWIDTFQEPMNTYALGQAFRSIDGVVATVPTQWIHYFSRLEVEPTSVGTNIRLYYGYGDCFAGCFGYDCWTFTVDNKFAVVYQGHVQQ